MNVYSTNSRICLLGIVLLVATASGFGSAAGAKPLVVATTTDLADFARNVGGDKVEVFCLLKAGENPHFVRPTPGAQRKVNQARLFIQTGLDLEIWAPTLLEGARNPNVMVLTATKGINMLEKPAGGVSPAQGDVHPSGGLPPLVVPPAMLVSWLDRLRGGEAILIRALASVMAAAMYLLSCSDISGCADAGVDRTVGRQVYPRGATVDLQYVRG